MTKTGMPRGGRDTFTKECNWASFIDLICGEMKRIKSIFSLSAEKDLLLAFVLHIHLHQNKNSSYYPWKIVEQREDWLKRMDNVRYYLKEKYGVGNKIEKS